MNTHTCLRLFVFAAVVTAFACAKAQSGEHRVYSNVKYNEEGGDLLGTELDLTINDGRVDGTLKIYQGGCADPVRLSGSSASAGHDTKSTRATIPASQTVIPSPSANWR